MSRALSAPSARLTAAAEMAAVCLYSGENENLVGIDVGCDHAKLAIYLIQSGICSHVCACDINEGPIEVAKKNISKRTLKGESLSNYIDVVHTDGFASLEDVGANRVFILGMGGEVIAGILDRASFIHKDQNKGKIKFILQPMTSEDDLRSYLCNNGYNILDERLVLDKGRVYSVMSVVFDGQKRSFSPAELLLGKANIEKGSELFCRQLNRRIRIAQKTLDDRRLSGLDCTGLEGLLNEMLEIKEKTNGNN